MTECPPPIIGSELWSAVMKAASQGGGGARCQCAGACGLTHKRGGGRCHLVHGVYTKGHGVVRLIAAPADPMIEGVAAMRLPADKLLAWCDSCLKGAGTRAREQASANASEALMTAETLF